MAKLIYANTKNGDMRYLVGIEIGDPFFLLEAQDKKYIFLDHREIGLFEEKNQNADIEGVLLNPLIEQAQMLEIDANATNKLALHIIQKFGVADEIIEVPATFPLELADFLRSQGIRLEIKNIFIPEREIKTEEEKNIIIENLKKTQKAYVRIEEILHNSIIENDVLKYEGKVLTSEFLKLESEKLLLEEGMLDLEGMIISCGSHAAIPHHRGEGIIRPHQAIVCDIFPWHRENGYYADMTRTYVKGKPPEELIKMYETVLGAQELAISLIKAGAKSFEIHKKVERFFIKQRYDIGDKGFIHGTGHGLGIEIHELPFVNSSAGNNILKKGHVVTVEPGLYYPKLGGIRIEDVVYVTEDGCENLTNYPNKFIIA